VLPTTKLALFLLKSAEKSEAFGQKEEEIVMQ